MECPHCGGSFELDEATESESDNPSDNGKGSAKGFFWGSAKGAKGGGELAPPWTPQQLLQSPALSLLRPPSHS